MPGSLVGAKKKSLKELNECQASGEASQAVGWALEEVGGALKELGEPQRQLRLPHRQRQLSILEGLRDSWEGIRCRWKTLEEEDGEKMEILPCVAVTQLIVAYGAAAQKIISFFYLSLIKAIYHLPMLFSFVQLVKS